MNIREVENGFIYKGNNDKEFIIDDKRKLVKFLDRLDIDSSDGEKQNINFNIFRIGSNTYEIRGVFSFRNKSAMLHALDHSIPDDNN